jgi:hypothetical protein
MTTIEEAIKWMDLDKRCGGYAGHCLKCDGVLLHKFDTTDSETRNALADVLCGCSLDDFQRHQPLLWLVALLNTARYEQFVAGIAKLAPFSLESAWQIIRLSEHNKGNWCFALEPYRKAQFKPRFHLHPTLAPSLLAATIRPGTESEDGVALLDFFAPIAATHPVLREALPLWRAAREHREEERKAEWLRQKEQERVEAEQRKAQWAAREAEFRAIEAGGPTMILRSVLEAPTLDTWDCCECWAKIPETSLNGLPREILDQVAHKIASQSHSRHWSGLRSRIEHLLKSRAHSADRSAWLAQFEYCPLLERLRTACGSRWSMTYFPANWAEEVLQEPTALPVDLGLQMLSKLMRLRRRGPSREVRRLLLRRVKI